jgi:hypothetical protein
MPRIAFLRHSWDHYSGLVLPTPACLAGAAADVNDQGALHYARKFDSTLEVPGSTLLDPETTLRRKTLAFLVFFQLWDPHALQAPKTRRRPAKILQNRELEKSLSCNRQGPTKCAFPAD